MAVLDDISLDIEHGEFISLIGPSGCGKTTFIEIVAGLQQQTSGGILVERPAPWPAAAATVPSSSSNTACFPGSRCAGTWNTGRAFGGCPGGSGPRSAKGSWAWSTWRDTRTTTPTSFPGGMQQRVALARSLANSPDILLLDEPFAALDSFTRERCQQELLGIWEETGLTVGFRHPRRGRGGLPVGPHRGHVAQPGPHPGHPPGGHGPAPDHGRPAQRRFPGHRAPGPGGHFAGPDNKRGSNRMNASAHGGRPAALGRKLVVPAAILAFWYMATRIWDIHPIILPDLCQVAEDFWTLLPERGTGRRNSGQACAAA